MYNYLSNHGSLILFIFVIFVMAGCCYNICRPSILHGSLKKYLKKNIDFCKEISTSEFHEISDSVGVSLKHPSNPNRELALKTNRKIDILDVVLTCQNFFIQRGYEIMESINDDDAYRLSVCKDHVFDHFEITQGQNQKTFLILLK